MDQATATTIKSVRIWADDYPESPREDCNVGVFVGFEHRSYNIGDRRPTFGELTALEYGGWSALVKHLQRQYGARHVLKVGMIDHSGVSYYIGGGAHWSDSAGWDSGTCGYIFDTAETRERTGIVDQDIDGTIQFTLGKVPARVNAIEAALEAEIEQYSQWASGDVYGFTVEARTLCTLCEAIEDDDDLPEQCPHCDVEIEDSCGGFYGSDTRENGMRDHIADDLREALREAEDHIDYGY